MRILVSRSEFNRKEVDFLKDRLVLVPKGGTAYKLALVAAGLYEGSLSVQPKTNWDFAAGMALLKAAGALVSDNKGQILEKLPPKVSGLCVASPQMHSTLVRWIRDVDVPDCRAKKPSTT
jgi:myo-inositol-1(or 4)-monophosphatase